MKDYTKKQKILIVLGVSLFILIGSGLTYAGLMWVTSNPINIGLTSGCFEINYTPGGAINNANVEVMNESTLISNNKFTITEGIALTYANIGIKSTCTIEGYGSLYLNVTSLSSAFTTGSSKGSLKYAILNNTSSVSTPSVSSLKGQSFDIIKTGTITSTGTVNILTKQLSNTSQYKYLIVFYIDGSKIGNDVVGASFAGNISADAHQGKLDLAKETLNYLKSLNSTITLANDTPDFTKVSGNNGGKGDGTKGIYAAEDDLGISYYFRGAVDNNYVKFANFYWRIIRINGDGTIRMIYAGTSAHANGESETDSYISQTAYNSSYNDNTYVGYMTGSTGATTYANTHSNTNNSTIKGVIDTWYKTNIEDKGYSSYVADAIYCNDRSIANDSATNIMLTKVSSSETNTGLGYGTNVTAYGGFKRNWVNHTPSLKCPNNNDKFTKSSILGNGRLTYPAALITSDEVVYAGGLADAVNVESYIKNTDYYLYTPSYWYWTLTPWAFVQIRSDVNYVDSDGYLSWTRVHYNLYAARPVVSLNSGAITEGNGTKSNPFMVG